MYFEILIEISYTDDLSDIAVCDSVSDEDDHNYSLYYIVEADNRKAAIKEIEKFISKYFADEEVGVEINNLTYEYLDGQVVKAVKIKKTTPKKFLTERIGDVFLINNINRKKDAEIGNEIWH